MRVEERFRRCVPAQRERAGMAARLPVPGCRHGPDGVEQLVGVISSVNLRDVMCSYGPELIQNSFV